jgi:hypothetical protein
MSTLYLTNTLKVDLYSANGPTIFFYKNILISNVAERNILIMVEEKK